MPCPSPPPWPASWSTPLSASGPAFLALIAPVLDAAGPLPHARLDADRDAAAADGNGGEAPLTTRPRKQASRHVRCACPVCGYVARTARKWLDQVGPPHCPQHGPMLAEAAAPVSAEPDQGAAS